MYTHACGEGLWGAQADTCTCRNQKPILSIFYYHSPSYFLRQGSSSCLARLACKPLWVATLSPPGWNYKYALLWLAFSISITNLNPHTCPTLTPLSSILNGHLLTGGTYRHKMSNLVGKAGELIPEANVKLKHLNLHQFSKP